ncbi:MAG: Tfp pilus assembly PilM family ATPase [Candidatus Binatia bacterium]
MAASPPTQNDASCGVGRGDRFVAIDPGVHSIKVLLGRRVSNGVRILDRQRVPLCEGGGSLSPEEVRLALRSILAKWSSHPILISLPQRSALSQVVDLPSANGMEIGRLIEAEIGKLGGLNESSIAFDYAPLEPFGKHAAPYWVSFCEEDELRGQITRLGLEMDDVCEITTTGNALLAACQFRRGSSDFVALIDLGAGDSTVVIVHQGQGVYTSSIPIGGDAFTDAISTGSGRSIEEAEEQKISRDLLNGSDGLQALRSAVDGWRREIERIIQEWSQDQGDEKRAMRVELYSGGSQLPGLVEHLNRGGGLEYSLGACGEEAGETDFVIGFGTGLVAAGLARQPASLIPAEARVAWSRARGLRQIQIGSLALLLIIFIMLGVGSWQKLAAVGARRERLAEQQAELSQVRLARQIEFDIARRYDRVRPILERQRRTLDTLEALATLDSTANKRDVWYALFADRETYVSMSEIAVSGGTNETVTATESAAGVGDNRGKPFDGGDSFIAVAAVPGQIEMVRETVSRLAEELNKQSLFEHVDLLSSDRRRLLVDPAVVVPERHYVFSLKLAKNVFKKTAIQPGGLPENGASDGEVSAQKTFRVRGGSVNESLPTQAP